MEGELMGQAQNPKEIDRGGAIRTGLDTQVGNLLFDKSPYQIGVWSGWFRA